MYAPIRNCTQFVSRVARPAGALLSNRLACVDALAAISELTCDRYCAENELERELHLFRMAFREDVVLFAPRPQSNR